MVTRITSNLIQPTSFKVGETLGADINMPKGKLTGRDKIEKRSDKDEGRNQGDTITNPRLPENY